MKTYIGCKIIRGEPMSHNHFLVDAGRPTLAQNEDGYKVYYPDGYESWSPTLPFESAYREILPGEMAMNGV